jgi:hypothetical protein
VFSKFRDASSASLTGKVAAAVGFLATFLAAVVLTATAASAHHPEVSFSVGCGYTVNWTASSWAPGTVQGSNPNITVEYRLDGGAWQPAGSGAFTIQSPSFSGSFTASGTPTGVQLRTKANANWANGQSGGQVVTASAQNFPTDCGSPEPHASAAMDCAQGGVVVSLSNSGTKAADFSVNGTPITLDAGQQAAHVIPVAENATVQVTVTGEGAVLIDQAFTRDCLSPQPSVAAIDRCVEGGIQVTMRNDGGEPADFTVNGTPVQVAPNSNGYQWLPVAEDQSLTVTVMSGGAVLREESVTQDCLEPEPEPEPQPDPDPEPEPEPEAPTSPPPTTTPPTAPPASPPRSLVAQPNNSVVKVTPAAAAPAQLAYTGSTSTDLLLPALGLLTIGGLLVAVTRRTRRA